MNKIKQWYNSLSEREQMIVLVASIVSIIAGFYLVVWSPLSAAIDDNRQSLKNDRQLLQFIAEQGNKARLYQSNTGTKFSGSITQVVNQTSRQANITISRMQPQNENLQVVIDQVVFNDLLNWLQTLEGRGIYIIMTDISEVDDDGFVQVRRLQLGAA